jgi:hypothetical protein
VFLETRTCGPRSVKDIFESSQSLEEHIKESNFNISSSKRQKYSCEIFRNIYRVLYGPWGSPTTQEWDIAEYLKNC